MYAIQCSRLFDGDRFSDGPATVLVDSGTIVGVQQGAPPLGEEWQLLSFPKATVLPGLIDAHVHLVADSRPGALDRVPGLTDDELDGVISEGLRRQLAAGVTTVRDLGDRRFAVVARRDRQRGADPSPVEPTILAAGPPLTSPGGHCRDLGGEVDLVDGWSRALGERVERGVDVVKVMASGGLSTPGTDVLRTQFSTDALRSLVEQAHAAGLPVTAHAHGLPAVEQAVAVGVDSIEHFSCLTERGHHLADELIAATAAAGIAISGVIPPAPTLDLPGMPAAVRELIARSGLTPERIRELRADMVRRLHEQGVRVVTGLDSGLNPWLAHGNLHLQLALLAEAGFTPAEVLAAATGQAAQVCGVGDRKGFLRRGYDADLLVLDGDLSTGVPAEPVVRSVLLGGRPVGES